jgi:hypothetical protein
MGIEIAIAIGLAIAGLFAANKTVEAYKHNATLDADRYAACIEATKNARQCRGLE